MIVIADGGSTKTNWCLINESGRKIHFNTEGYNPYFVSSDYIKKSLKNTLPAHFEKEKLTEVYYYGAGCSTEANQKIVADAMQSIFVNAKINIGHDLLASCRALLGLSLIHICSRSYPSLRIKLDVLNDEDHLSVAPRGFTKGLQFLLAAGAE